MVYEATISRLPPTAIIDLRGPSASVSALLEEMRFPRLAGPNRLAETGGAVVAWVGQEHWLVLAALEREDELMAALSRAPGAVGAILVSDAYAGFGITGPQASHVLAQAAPLDVHARVFPEDGASFTEFFGQKALVMRRGGGFECRVDASYGDYVADFLSRCGGQMA
jgi:sarcosine oxidase subunit gamma